MGHKNSKEIKTIDKCDLIIDTNGKSLYPINEINNNGFAYIYFETSKKMKRDKLSLDFSRINNNNEVIHEKIELDLFLLKSKIINYHNKIYREYEIRFKSGNMVKIRYGKRNQIVYIYRKC